MSLPLRARHFLIHELVQALTPISGTDWEPIGDFLAERMAGVELKHRGQGIKGTPQGYTIDSYADAGTIAAEYGAEDGYFKNELGKPNGDYDHVCRLLPSATTIYLLSSQSMTAKEAMEVQRWQAGVSQFSGVRPRVM